MYCGSVTAMPFTAVTMFMCCNVPTLSYREEFSFHPASHLQLHSLKPSTATVCHRPVNSYSNQQVGALLMGTSSVGVNDRTESVSLSFFPDGLALTIYYCLVTVLPRVIVKTHC